MFQEHQKAVRRQLFPGQVRNMPKNRPGAESDSGLPAELSGRMPQRSSTAVTCRVRVRSGVIRAAVVPVSAASRRIRAIAVASWRWDCASIRLISCVAAVRSGSSGPLQPTISNRGGAKRERNQFVALRIGRVGPVPFLRVGWRKAQPIKKPAKTKLRMILGSHRI